MNKFFIFFKENKKKVICLIVIIIIAWIAIEFIENWEAAQEGFYEGLYR